MQAAPPTVWNLQSYAMQSNSRPTLIGITGGIGAGKSVVSRVIALRGIPVYDCDYEARRLMDSSEEIKRELCNIAGTEVLCADGSIHRPALATRLFSEPELREKVNALVHARVREHLLRRIDECTEPIMAVESAILFSSSLSSLMDEIWLVEAPEPLRISRIMRRNNLSRSQARERIEAQRKEFQSLSGGHLHRIINDDVTPLLPQIDKITPKIHTNA